MLAQGVAVLIIILLGIGGQAKTQKMFLFSQLIVNTLYVLHYVLLSATTAVAVCIVCVLRTLIFYLYRRADKDAPIWLLTIIFIVVIGAGLVTWQNMLSILPVLATISFTYGQWQHNIQTTRKTAIAGNVGWVIYNLFCFAYVDLIGKIVEITSYAIAMYRHDKGKTTNYIPTQ